MIRFRFGERHHQNLGLRTQPDFGLEEGHLRPSFSTLHRTHNHGFGKITHITLSQIKMTSRHSFNKESCLGRLSEADYYQIFEQGCIHQDSGQHHAQTYMLSGIIKGQCTMEKMDGMHQEEQKTPCSGVLFFIKNPSTTRTKQDLSVGHTKKVYPPHI